MTGTRVTQPFRLPPVRASRLSCGVNLWLVPTDAFPTVAVHLVVNAGAEFDSEARAGLASLTAEGLETGTGGLDSTGLASAYERLGAHCSSTAGFDGAHVSLLALPSTLEDALALTARIVVTPSFPPVDVSRLIERRVTSLKQRVDRPGTVASLAFLRLVYGSTHPYGKDPHGMPATVAAIDRKDLALFHAARYSSADSTLIAVGRFDEGRLIDTLERLLESWKRATPPPPAPIAPPAGMPAGLYLIHRPDAAQTEIRIGRAGFARAMPDYVPFQVANRILGGQFTSRLNRNLREQRGLTYGVHSSFQFRKGPGPFLISTSVDTGGTAEAVRETLGELRRFCEQGIAKEEARAAVRGLDGGFVVGLETPSQYAGALATSAMHGLGKDYLERFRDQLALVTSEEVHEAVRPTLRPDLMTVLLYGDRNLIERQFDSRDRSPVVCDRDGDILPS